MSTLENALIENSLDKLMLVPKSDIHSHGGKGGRIKDYAKWSNASIKVSERPFQNLDDMQSWFNSNIKIYDSGKTGYLKRIEALKRVSHISEHPIKELFENGIPVTINTDDLLIFDSSVSEEYLKLYTNKIFSIGELEIIRQNGLKSYE